MVGSSMVCFSPGLELYGSHPLLDPLLSGGRMSIRNDEGFYWRADKAAHIVRYPDALENMRVCFHPYRADRNCCRCEKCIRTMLCFVANGDPIPPAFPDGLRLRDIGIGMGKKTGLHKARGIIAAAKRHGTLNDPAIRILCRRYRTKWLKVHAKNWAKWLIKGGKPYRWHVLEEL